MPLRGPRCHPFTGRYTADFERTRAYNFLRYGQSEAAVFTLSDQYPAFNVAGLYFKPLPAGE